MSETIVNVADLDNRAVTAKESKGDMEKFIEDYIPFLRARVARYSAQPDSDINEKLLSVAMLAFYESVRSYDPTKGHFFPFADMVVKRRIFDSLRSEYRDEEKTVPFDEEIDEPANVQSSADIEISLRYYDEQRRRESLAEEIEHFKEELMTWGITMKKLSENSPKHKKLLESYRRAVAVIADEADIAQTIQLKRYFPVKKISEATGLPQKNIERARTFILASLIIKFGEYENLSDYIIHRRE
jgi:RNA polymerase sigma factor